MTERSIRAGVIGGAGYTGGELLRLLLPHPQAEVVFVHSRSHAGAPVSRVHTDLYGDTELQFVSEPVWDIDVLFLCVGHGEARAFMEATEVPAHVSVIDLSQDYRLEAHAVQGGRRFVYGLPEHQREAIRGADCVANPGCFATAIQLALLPLADAGLSAPVHITGVTGATGAGQKLQASSHFAWRSNNIQAYKTLSHQHVPEVRQTLSVRHAAFGDIFFVPWRGDFSRGIYITAYAAWNGTPEEAFRLYGDFYRDHPFTHVSRTPVDLKQVVNTNKCLLYLEQEQGQLVIHAAIDNLLKGASGQAVQNMNLMFGLPEQTGLMLKATAF